MLEKQKAVDKEQPRRARHWEECQAAVLLKERLGAEIHSLNAILREQGQKNLGLFMKEPLGGNDAVEAPGDAGGEDSSDEE